MGPKVLELDVSLVGGNRSSVGAAPEEGLPANASKMLRGYAHCSREVAGAATVLLINLGSNTSFEVSPSAAAVTMDGGGRWRRQQQLEWHLSAVGGNIHGKSIELNGEVLALEAGNTKMPAMPGRPGGTAAAAGGTAAVVVGPASVVFIQLPPSAALAAVCS
eukprot:SAG22_NODE_613_length_8567_cov_4.215163_8_plen_162_part_00